MSHPAKPLAPSDPPISSPHARTAGTLDVVTLDAAHEDGGYLVVDLDGHRERAILGEHVADTLAQQCLREGRPVIVRERGGELVILGALQTQASPVVERDGVVVVEGEEIRLEAKRQLGLEVGPTRVTLQRGGRFELIGERVTMQVASLIKLIASKVELP